MDDEPEQEALSTIEDPDVRDPDDPVVQDEVAARLMAAAARLRAGLEP